MLMLSLIFLRKQITTFGRYIFLQIIFIIDLRYGFKYASQASFVSEINPAMDGISSTFNLNEKVMIIKISSRA